MGTSVSPCRDAAACKHGGQAPGVARGRPGSVHSAAAAAAAVSVSVVVVVVIVIAVLEAPAVAAVGVRADEHHAAAQVEFESKV